MSDEWKELKSECTGGGKLIYRRGAFCENDIAIAHEIHPNADVLIDEKERIPLAKVLVTDMGFEVVPATPDPDRRGEPEIEDERPHKTGQLDPDAQIGGLELKSRKPEYSSKAAHAFVEEHIKKWMVDVGLRFVPENDGTYAHYRFDNILECDCSIIFEDTQIQVCHFAPNSTVTTSPAAAYELFKTEADRMKPQLIKELFERELGRKWEVYKQYVRPISGDGQTAYEYRIDMYSLATEAHWVKGSPSAFVSAYRTTHPKITYTFKECPECAKKTGHPVLCPSCLHNRSVIEDLLQKIEGNE